jgi:3-oxoacyl-[acyl-carrier-protein] synthase III
MLVMYMDPAARCPGAVLALVQAAESFMRDRGYRGAYVVRTEVVNKRANRFWASMGAKFVFQDAFHGRLINEYHKSLAAGEAKA